MILFWLISYEGKGGEDERRINKVLSGTVEQLKIKGINIASSQVVSLCSSILIKNYKIHDSMEQSILYNVKRFCRNYKDKSDLKS